MDTLLKNKLLNETVQKISGLDKQSMAQARQKLDGLLKPQGSLGKLEDIAVQLSGIYGTPAPQLEAKAIVMMAADNGVYEEGFNAYPQEITKTLAELAEPGLIGVAVLARQAGSRLVVVDIGIKGQTSGNTLLNKRIRNGTDNIARGPAMTRQEAIAAITAGIETVNSLVEEGVGVFGSGEVGICNTTTSAAVIAGLYGLDPAEVTGRGTGGDEKAYRMKLKAINDALAVNRPDPNDALDVLSKVGGLDIAGLAGCYLAAAAQRKPIVIDGFIAGAAALVAIQLCPTVRDYLFPSHLSAEKGARLVLEKLGLEPMLLMNMRLGEGTGAALTFNLLDAACHIINEMGSFADLTKE
jgi:nicotinate-nucleotide--dimethylbenzimidazole phosphoribosyltransferase